MVNFLEIENKEMANGFWCHEARFLTEEISFLKKEIATIKANEAVFAFNDPNHIVGISSNSADDKIYVDNNVFPNDRVYSSHPHDQFIPRAVLTHEYYGYRPERKHYLQEDGGEVECLPRWQDEVYASLNAAIDTPNLSQQERATLINEAGIRAQEDGKTFALTDVCKEILYGEWNDSSERDSVSIAKTVVKDTREPDAFLEDLAVRCRETARSE